MKIGFALGKITGEEFYGLAYNLVEVTYNYSEIKKAKKRGLHGHTKTFFDFIQALSRNDLFEQEILRSREKIGLPQNGLPFEKYKTYGYHDRETILKYFDQLDRFHEQYVYPLELETYLYDIIFYGIVSPFESVQSEISWHTTELRADELERTTGEIKSIMIKIVGPITKNAFHRYIDKEWPNIQEKIKLLAKKSVTNFASINDRDLEILSMRNEQKLTFSKIADKISKKYDSEEDSTINEDSVKTAYKRAREKIANTFALKK